MKKKLLFHLRSIFLLGLFLSVGRDAYANHILGMDLNYQWVSGNTYKITLVAYGDCGAVNFGSLATAAPTICIYNGNTSVATMTLTIVAPSAGTEITPVCIADIGMTTCTSPTMTIPGVKKFVYSGTYTLPSTSAVWRFVFNGYMGASAGAGRAAAITNINAPGGSIIELIDTLNNTTGNNTSPVLSVVPTPYYCLNTNDNYNPGASDVDGDSLRFNLVAGKVGTGTTSCTVSGTTVTYLGGYSATAPLSANAGTFSFNSSNGQISFNPNIAQRSLVVYNVDEYRGGTLIGTSQREMSFLVQTCTNAPANGPISGASSGTIIDSTHYQICQNTGAFTFHVDPTETNPASHIKIVALSLPAGSTFTIAGDSTNAPIGTFSWTSNGIAPGTYSFVLNFMDDNCPIGGSNSVAFNITIQPTPVIIPATSTVCATSTITLSDNVPGGAWSTANTTIATVVAGTGVVTGVTGGAAVITYTSSAGCITNATVTVNPQPAVISGNTTICVGSTTTLSDATAGGVWSSGTTTVATIAGVGSAATAGGVATGTSVITYKLSATGCARTTTLTVNPPPGAISGIKSVCVGLTTNLSDATAGGTWSSSNTSATISGTGVVTGQAAGTPTITYGIGTGCIVTTTVTVNALPVAITPSGAVSLCIGGNLALSDATAGGAWSSSNTSLATVTGAGLVHGIAVGSVNITYTNASGCYVIQAVTINTAPPAISPNPATVCSGTTVNLSDGIAGGAWSSGTTSLATINPVTGLVSGVANGNVTITYAIGTCSVTSTVIVKPTPAAIIPVAAVNICIGTSATLSDATAGGVWSSSSTALATVSAAGVVSGVAPGVPTITYASGGCFVTKAVTVNTTPAAILPTPATVCVGTTKVLSDAVTGGAWSSSSTALATVDPIFGIVTGVGIGSPTITYSIGTCFSTSAITVNPAPSAGTISGPTNLCVGGITITLSDGTAGGVWSSSNTSLATISAGGVVTGVAPGTDIISYSVTGICGTVSATYTITVNTTSGAGVIVGPTIICAGLFTTLTETVPSGVWSVFNTDASITGTGLLTGITPGIDTVYYTVTNACGVFVAKRVETIGAFLTAGTISGPTSVCAGSSFNLSDGTPGGVWSSTNTSVATISGVGVVSGISSGTTVISYLVISGCGSTATTYTVTVNPLPAAGSIIGPSTICAGTFTILSDAVSGGVWSSSNTSIATITGGGLAYGITAGTTTIAYTFTNSCGTATASQVTTISPSPSPGSIVGSSVVCVGTTIALTDAVAGGVWSSSNSHATVLSNGIVTGVSAGADTILYSITTSCGSVSTTHAITVNPALSAGTIIGPSNVCVSSLISLSDATPGGVWSAANANATITTGGVVTGITPGTDTISYSVFSTCGMVSATKIISVYPTVGAGTISGPSVVCPGGVISLSDAFTGGVWSVNNTAIATISATGVLHGVSIGTDTVYYTLVSTCGTNISSVAVSVSTTPFINPISGPSSVCIGTSITLTDPTGGGVWSAGNTHATVSGGVVNGITLGSDVISYSVTNSCGTAVATQTVTVVSFPVVTVISGPSSVCVGASITLSESTAGGVWSSTNTNAIVSSASGVVTGVATGSDIITYLLTNACGTVGTSKTITVNPLANPGTIIGPDSVCAGSTISLADGAPGGVWSSGNANATVSGGITTGVSGGTVPISYTVTNMCGPISAVQIVTVVAAPNAGTITGPASVCVGSGITLVDIAPGGTWLSSNSNATIVAPGIVDGVTAGIDTIFYLVNNVCGAAVANKVITVNPLPVIAAISGPTSQCVGTIITLSDATPGGEWFSSNPSTAAISLSTGVTNGVSAGIVNITYTVTNAFGCPASVISVDTVLAIPGTSPITGSANVCLGSFTALSDATAGGVWSSSNTSVATVDAAGNVNGVALGSVTITYSVVNMCGSATMTKTETVYPLPVVTAISGAPAVCVGASVTLSDATPGGVWSSNTTSIATVGTSSGIVTGVGAGTVIINYTVTSAFGCSASVMVAETVNALPVIAAINGTTGICIGSTSALTDITPGGVWSSSNTAIATIDPSGVVSGFAGGSVTISYSVTNGSGCTASATTPYIVDTIPSGGILPAGSATLCHGNPVLLSVSATAGITYQWLYNGSTIPGATSSSYTAITSGTFSVIISNGICSETLPGTVVTGPPNPVISFDPPNILYTGTYTSYQWYLNGVPLSGDTTGMIYETGLGYYTVVVTDQNGCSDSSSAFASLNVTSVIPVQDIKVYPNPATSALHIDAAEKVNITVLSVDGKILITQKDAVNIDIHDLANGMYMIMIYDQNNIFIKTVKFAKIE